jgi:beta-galactosidase/beta-glucuronidase
VSAQPRPEHPQPRFRREGWINLNGEWEFGAGEQPAFARTIVVPFAAESELSGMREYPGDIVWYRRRVEAPAEERLRLHFGAVDYRASVWVDGVEVARHEGGHTPFSADLPASVGRQFEIVVRAEDPLADRTIPRGKQYWKPEPEGIFYTPTTGIWQTVWLEPLPLRQISSLRLHPDPEGGALGFEIVADGRLEVTAQLDGRPCASWRGEPGPGRMRLEEVRLWSPEEPALYDLDIRLFDDAGGEVDRVESYFGLRTVAASDGHFLLNGERFVQRLVLDQGYFRGGWYTAATDADLRRDIELAKAMGFNGARKHQKVEDPRWLYWADRLGFLVWGEMANANLHSPDGEERLLREWAAAVERDRDHPCIVAWVPLNESWGVPPEAAAQAAMQERLYRLTHSLDDTRPVVSNDGWEQATTDLCTLHDYDPPPVLAGRYRSLAEALKPQRRGDIVRSPYLPGFSHRGEPLLVSEFGGLKLSGAGGWGYGEVGGPEELLAEYTARVRALVEAGPVEGFCYTQLADVEQERNGLLTFDRRPKLEPELIRRATETPKGPW